MTKLFPNIRLENDMILIMLKETLYSASMQVLTWSSWDFLSPLVLQKMKEDYFSQLDNYDEPFCEQ